MVPWGRRLLLAALAGWGLFLAVRCHLPRQPDGGRGSSPDSTSAVYLVRHGWHAGIAVRRADVSDDAWPILNEFPDARYLEVGWGEAGYYPGTSRGVWGTARAGAWPTESVVHVVPITDSVPYRFDRHTIVRIPVGPDDLDALTRYVAASFAFDDAGNARPAANGYYPKSRFYASSLPYHLLNNCNHWAAGAIEAAGCDTAPRWTMTVGPVMEHAKRCGTLVQRRGSD